MTLTKSDRDIIVSHNIGKAYQAIEDAEILLNNNSFAGSLNRIYYGVFFMISALAIKKEYKTSKHSQLIGWFNKNYVRNFKISRDIGRFIHIAFE